MDHTAVKASLNRRLVELLSRHEKIAAHFRPQEALSDDWEEQAQELENEEVLGALDDAARAEIVGIRAALDRIRQGRYGLCTSCGEAIAPRRLQALPTTPLCVDCAAD